MARQLPRSNSPGISRKRAIAAVGGVLCIAVFAAAASAGSWQVAGPAAAVARMADVASLRSASGDFTAQFTALNLRQSVNSEQMMSRSAGQQTLAMEAARRTAAAQVEAAEVAAGRRAAAAARQAAVRQAAALEAAAARQATETRQAAQLAAQQSPAGSPQQIAQQMLGQYGWAGQFSCLDSLWTLESGWNIYAENPATGAYGIPQALPGSKMASAGPDWQSDPATQIRWGLDYIQASYGFPCAAWSHEEADGWY